MTAQLREYWLDIAYHLHLGPSEQNHMTVIQAEEAIAAVKEIRAEANKKK